MHIVIVHNTKIPVLKYGGIERVIWYLGKALAKKGHHISFLVPQGSYSSFANIIVFNPEKSFNEQIPDSADVLHFSMLPGENIKKPYIFTMHGNVNDATLLDINTIFVSKNHAARFGSTSFVYNGMDWDDYGKPDLTNQRNRFHFLGDAAWRVKNVKGAIQSVLLTKKEELMVLGGNRLNFRMGFRFTTGRRIHFYGMVGGAEKNHLLNQSKGLVFPVRWHEPFGIALTESLYFGCPVFGTPYGSLPEIIPSDVGFLSDSATELSKAIEDSESYSRTRCHEYARDVFNAEKMAEAYVEKYEKVMNGEQLNMRPPQLLSIQNEKFLSWH
ncbi:glycosyltransferase [Hydrotalea sp.]|uniref:glycosyltransferase n=1 Tax=Hydrotalea sp. TaxID=2881279 RepID=UPI00261D05AF|nr:glycosyltransferase [Hydrotalea sp.]